MWLCGVRRGIMSNCTDLISVMWKYNMGYINANEVHYIFMLSSCFNWLFLGHNDTCLLQELFFVNFLHR